MKTFVHVLLIAAFLVACAHGFPRTQYDSDEDDFNDDSVGFEFAIPSFFSDTFNRMRQNLLNYFWNRQDITKMEIPDGANTTSTTKIINGHVVTINETTYSTGDDVNGAAFRIRIIDVKPLNDTGRDIPELTEKPQATVKPVEPPESRETVEDFNNEISKNAETLTA